MPQRSALRRGGQPPDGRLARTRLQDGDGAIVAAYIDGTQSYDVLPDGTVIPVPRHSRMGVAVRRDSTGTWEVRTPLRPTFFRRLSILLADPWLTTDDTGSRIYYSFLAVTDEAPDTATPDALAIARSDDGGITWQPAFPLLRDAVAFDEGPLTVIPFPGVDKPSIASSPSGRQLHIASVCPVCRDNTIRVITASEAGNVYDVDIIGTGAAPQNPIIRTDPLDPTRRILVAFQERVGTGTPFTWRIRIAISDDGGFSYTVHDVTDPGELIGPAFPRGAGGLFLRNGVAMDFASPGSNFHYIVYESGGVVFGRFSIGGEVWSARQQLSTSPQLFLDFQPTIAGFRRNPGFLNDELAVVWYEQANDTATTSVVGVITDMGLSIRQGPTFLTRDPTGTPITFEPCPRIEGSVQFFGDYMGVIAVDSGPGFYAAWADSREGCTTASRLRVVHQHVRGTRFE